MAFWRPQPERHNIAEIALLRAFYSRTVRARLLGSTPERFPLDGEDWFAAGSPATMPWHQILGLVEIEQERLAGAIGDLAADREHHRCPRTNGSTSCWASPATRCTTRGEIQLIKRLRETAAS